MTVLVVLTLVTDEPILAIGGAITAINSPVYAYIFGETKRPSENDNLNEKENT